MEIIQRILSILAVVVFVPVPVDSQDCSWMRDFPWYDEESRFTDKYYASKVYQEACIKRYESFSEFESKMRNTGVGVEVLGYGGDFEEGEMRDSGKFRNQLYESCSALKSNLQSNDTTSLITRNLNSGMIEAFKHCTSQEGLHLYVKPGDSEGKMFTLVVRWVAPSEDIPFVSESLSILTGSGDAQNWCDSSQLTLLKNADGFFGDKLVSCVRPSPSQAVQISLQGTVGTSRTSRAKTINVPSKPIPDALPEPAKPWGDWQTARLRTEENPSASWPAGSFYYLYDTGSGPKNLQQRPTRTVRIWNLGPKPVLLFSKVIGCNIGNPPDPCRVPEPHWTHWCNPITVQPGRPAEATGIEVAVGLEGTVRAHCLAGEGQSWLGAVASGLAEIAYDCKGQYCQ